MEVVLDANVIFSSLIKESHTRHLLLSSGWTFYVPEFVRAEIRKHIGTLAAKTSLSEEEVGVLLDALFMAASVKIVPFGEFSRYLEKATAISPDPDDIHYFALALKLDCPIWSNDKRLQSQKLVRIYTTGEITKRML